LVPVDKEASGTRGEKKNSFFIHAVSSSFLIVRFKMVLGTDGLLDYCW